MRNLIGTLKDLYIRFLVWLGAAPPPGYEYLLSADEAGPREYTLKEGETIFSVARKFGVHYNLIAQANGLEDPETVQPGETLLIPPPEWDPASGPLVAPSPEPPEPVPSPAVPPAPTEPPVSPDKEAGPEAIDWLAEAEQTSVPFSAEEEPTLLPDEIDTSAGTPEWLLADEPLPQAEAVDDNTLTDDISLDRLQWLVAAEPLKAETQPPVPETAPGETLASPEVAPSPVAAAGREMVFRYQVQRGDTLSSIAKRYSLTVKDLVEANGIADPNFIFPGQKLVIPGYMHPKPGSPPGTEAPQPPPPPVEFFIYTVAQGDTLSAIAKRYGVTVRQLVEANQVQEPNLIRVGQRLVIPGVIQPPTAPPPEPPPQVGTEPIAEPKPAQPESLPEPVDASFPPLGPGDAIRALYVSYFAIGHAELRQHVFSLLDTTEFNAVVIDAKSDYGWISYPTQIPLAHEIEAARPTARDFDQVLQQFKARGIYTIARIVTFKDSPLAKSRPDLAVKIKESGEIWQDRENLSWSDPFLKPVWDYNVQVAVEAAQKGFDEIQFDYVRFPTASQAGAPHFSQEVNKETRVAAVTGFLSAMRGQLEPFGVKVAADTFGYTCWRKDDTLIGQDIERMARYLDVLSPMLYPSTFGSGIPNYKLAIAHPYEVVYESAKRAVERVSQLGCTVRPWIQDFPDYRFDRRVYGRAEIQAQIKGCFDAGSTGFMVWDPRVKYTDGAYALVVGRS
ncbi:MAG: LysM peptidoglycan-binding domain-containing protein [Anaerolineae bacterium]|nr:LysM peptidoglycan-binding domain-containing protein [Anaerolineae bacterium]